MTEVLNNLASVRRHSSQNFLHTQRKSKKSAAVFPEQDQYGAEESHELTETSYSDLSISASTGLPSTPKFQFSDWSRVSFSKDAFSYAIYEEGLKQVVTWVLNPTRSEGLEELSISYAEKAESCYAQFHYKDSSGSNNPWRNFRTGDVSSSWMWDIDRSGFCGSLLEKQTGLDDFPPDFPSPTYMKRDISLGVSAFSTENILEDDTLKDVDKNEPLFWPPESNSSWNSAALFDCFSMSPRRSLSEITNSERFCAPKSVILRLQSSKFKNKTNEQSSPSAKVCGLKTSAEKRDLRRSKPSKLSISSQVSIEKSSVEIKESCEESTKKDISQGEINTDYKDLLEACLLSRSDVAIESLVGLNEFDGHEGFGEEFNAESFFLDEPLSEDQSLE